MSETTTRKLLPATTRLGLPPTREPAQNDGAMTRAQLIAMATNGARGAGLGARSTQLICSALIDAMVGQEAAETLLAAERAKSASLQRQLALKIDSFTFTAMATEPDESPETTRNIATQQSAFDEATCRRRPAVIRREPRMPCTEVRQ